MVFLISSFLPLLIRKVLHPQIFKHVLCSASQFSLLPEELELINHSLPLFYTDIQQLERVAYH